MKVAAYQAPLLDAGSMEALRSIRAQVQRCEMERVAVLCCPEGVLGGLADDADDPHAIAISVRGGHLESVLAPLASNTVTTIVGFTERGDDGRLYNSAAVYHRGTVIGVYRKQHPAINRSVYSPGIDSPVFAVGALTFGIVICYDTAFVEPARTLAGKGARVLFVPSNTGLPPARAYRGLVQESRDADAAIAVANGVWVVRADVAGRTERLVSFGATSIIDPAGAIVQSTTQPSEDLLVAELDAGRDGPNSNTS